MTKIANFYELEKLKEMQEEFSRRNMKFNFTFQFRLSISSKFCPEVSKTEHNSNHFLTIFFFLEAKVSTANLSISMNWKNYKNFSKNFQEEICITVLPFNFIQSVSKSIQNRAQFLRFSLKFSFRQNYRLPSRQF